MKKIIGLIVAGIVAISAISIILAVSKEDHSHDQERIENGARKVS